MRASSVKACKLRYDVPAMAFFILLKINRTEQNTAEGLANAMQPLTDSRGLVTVHDHVNPLGITHVWGSFRVQTIGSRLVGLNTTNLAVVALGVVVIDIVVEARMHDLRRNCSRDQSGR
jgi:hypothetical protein